jgi:hypothetical protein
MRLCMFTPADSELERGWPGRIEGNTVTQLAAQTLQSYFASGSSAREHAAYPLEQVRLRAPVLEPPSVRVFEDRETFSFANPTAIRSPGTEMAPPKDRDFALLLGPAVETRHDDGFDWEGARALAAENTRLRPGDLLVGPVLALHEEIACGGFVVSFEGIGELAAFVS